MKRTPEQLKVWREQQAAFLRRWHEAGCPEKSGSRVKRLARLKLHHAFKHVK
jgi:hypothetical protein